VLKKQLNSNQATGQSELDPRSGVKMGSSQQESRGHVGDIVRTRKRYQATTMVIVSVHSERAAGEMKCMVFIAVHLNVTQC